MSGHVSIEVAEKEITSWLDYKKVGERKREAYATQVENLIQAIGDGDLIFNEETKELIQKLKFPIGENGTITQFTFSPRIDIKKVRLAMSGVGAKDADLRIVAYISAITSQTKTIIEMMDSEDATIAQDIAIFFI